MKNIRKKCLFLVLILAAALLCSGCSSGGSESGKTVSEVPQLLNQAEYVLYQNVYYNGYGATLNGSPVTKNGVFAILEDAYNGRTRYYVWGYLDNTLCCDWQWEFVPSDMKSLPAPGSVITVSGDFVSDGDALDGYWIKDAQITVESTYTGPKYDVNMQAMSDTLERVQVLNIQNRQEQFEGKTYAAYGRVSALNILQDPYYGEWQIAFAPAGGAASPAIGADIQLNGKIASGILGEAVVNVKN